MSEVEGNDIYNLSPIHKWIIAAALSVGTANGFMGLTKHDDRYRGAQAREDFAIRDSRIEKLERELHLHLEHSSRYTQVIKEHDKDIDELEEDLENHRHYNKEMFGGSK